MGGGGGESGGGGGESGGGGGSAACNFIELLCFFCFLFSGLCSMETQHLISLGDNRRYNGSSRAAAIAYSLNALDDL